MNIHVCMDYSELSRRAADMVSAVLERNPGAGVALPTGNTPLGMYRELRARLSRGSLDLGAARLYALDEIWPVPSGHAWSFAAFLRRELISHGPVGTFDHLRSDAVDPFAECRRYSEAIISAGGLDLAVLGIGRNGHIGYNEPGSDPATTCLQVRLTVESREAVRTYFPGMEPPLYGLTMGLGLIMSAGRIILMAAGEEKAEIVARALRGHVSPDVPASFLQEHPDVTVLLDESAAYRTEYGRAPV